MSVEPFTPRQRITGQDRGIHGTRATIHVSCLFDRPTTSFDRIYTIYRITNNRIRKEMLCGEHNGRVNVATR